MLLLPMVLLKPAFMLVLPLSFQWLVNEAIPNKDTELLIQIFSLLAGALLMSMVADLGQEMTAAGLGAKILANLRLQMYLHLQRLPEDFYHRRRKGELISRFSNDLLDIEQVITKAIPLLAYGTGLFTTVVILLFYTDWRLTLLFLALLPLLSIGPRIFGTWATQASDHRKASDAELSNTLQETHSGHRVVYALALQQKMRTLFASKAEAWRHNTFRMILFNSLIRVSSDSAIFLLLLVILVVGAYFCVTGSLSIGGLFTFMGLLITLSEVAIVVSPLVDPVVRSRSGMQRVGDLLSERQMTADQANASHTVPAKTDIVFKDIRFGYTPDKVILQGLNLQIPEGQHVAVVGTSGTGKSSLLNLLMRSWEPQEGMVTLGGVNLKNIHRNALLKELGIVFQDTFLFDDTIAENIRQGQLDAGQDAIEQAAKAADIHDVIMALPKGYATPVGEQGGMLSGGQRQRIAIARAIIRKPRILLFDEATSALDPATQAAVEQTIARVGRDRTIISVTHRLASARAMDRILVLDKGQVAEQGSHDDLIAANGVYAYLWQKQSGFHQSADGQQASVEVKRLQSISLLSKLPEASIEKLAERFETKHFNDGEMIITQGEHGQCFYIIIQGSAEVLIRKPDGSEQQINVMEIGDHFGEISLITDQLTTASVRARRYCVCLSLSRIHFQQLLDENQAIREMIMPVIKERLQRSALAK